MRSRPTIAVIAAATLSVVLIACNDDDDDDVDDTTSGPARTEATGTSPGTTDTTSAPAAATTEPTTAPTGSTAGTVEDDPETLPEWWESPPQTIHIDVRSCPEPNGAPVHFRDNAVVVLEARPGDAAALVPVLQDRLDVEVVEGTSDQDPDGVQRLVFSRSVPVDALVEVVHGLQAEGTAVDLDYVHAILPNYQPQPDDVPAVVPSGDPGVNIPSSGGTVAVVDVGVEEWSTFTVLPTTTLDPALYVDPFDDPRYHNHGPFIADLIKRHANETTVELWPVAGPAVDAVAGTPVFDGAIDEDGLLTTIAAAAGRTIAGDGYVYRREVPLDVLNLSLGGYGCDVYPHLPLAALLAEIVDQTGTLVVAAAGNDGSEHYHFPAAFTASSPLAADLATRLPSDRAEAILRLGAAVVSVGSATPADELPGGSSVGSPDVDPGDCFSNYGAWVDAWAPGAQQIGRLTETDWVYWSGTSFAAPRFTAAIVGASTFPGMRPVDVWMGSSGRDPATYNAAVKHPNIQFTPPPDGEYHPPNCP